jgi:hypothetical protein
MDVTIEIPKLYPLQEEIKASTARYKVVAAGRRTGKTELGKNLTLPVVQGAAIGWFCFEYKFLEEPWQQLVGLYKPLIKHSDAVLHRIDLYGGGVLECWTLKDNLTAGRSRGYDRVIIDEAAWVKKLLLSWNGSIRATLAVSRGDAWFVSSPQGYNDFHKLWKRGDVSSDEHDPEWQSWQIPSIANPLVTQDELDEIRRTTPELWYQQEYEAKFVDLENILFSQEMISAAFDSSIQSIADMRAGAAVGREDLFVDIPRIAIGGR